jgi:hypothetical protein
MSGDTLFIRVSIQVATVEVAHINCAVEVMKQEAGSSQNIAEADNPLAEASLNSNTSSLYQTIFISYSRKDTEVVKVYKLVQEAVGNIAFKDTDSIRAGENWRSALALAIDQADIFQLFWSENSAQSENVHNEWEYALKHIRCCWVTRTATSRHTTQRLSWKNFLKRQIGYAEKSSAKLRHWWY